MASSDPAVSHRVPSFLRRPTDDPLLHPQYDFRAMDYYLASRQGFEDASTVQQRNLDYVEQLPRFAMSLLPPGINSQIELEMYLADLSLTQAYYFRMLPPDAPVDDTRRTDWLRDVFDIDSPDQWATPLAWAERPLAIQIDRTAVVLGICFLVDVFAVVLVAVVVLVVVCS